MRDTCTNINLLWGKMIGVLDIIETYIELYMSQKQIGQTDLPVEKTWRLNERHYGGLTGLNKAETAAKHGDAQVQVG